MGRFVLTTLTVLFCVACSRMTVYSEEPFQSYECYRDLCVDRLQFCDDGEERCKYCTRAHCLPGANTPEGCKKLCPELLSTTTTTQSTTTTTTTTTDTTPPLCTPKTGGQTDENGTITFSASYLVVAMVVLLLLVILVVAAVILHYVKKTYDSLLLYKRRFSGKDSQASLEEGEALLSGSPNGSSSGVKNGGHSCSDSTGSSTAPSMSQGDTLQIFNPSRQPSSGSDRTAGAAGPAYTARPVTNVQGISRALPDTGSTSSLHHHKGYDYRLTNRQTDGCYEGPPPYVASESAVSVTGHQHPQVCQQPSSDTHYALVPNHHAGVRSTDYQHRETCPKSI